MNLDIRGALNALIGKAPRSTGAIATSRRSLEAMGPWSATLGAFIPRQVDPHLYEALREAIGLLDGAIETLVTLDGIVRVEGDNDKLVTEIEDFINFVPVNDLEAGFQAFYASQGNECYEQGFNVGEWVPDRSGRDIASLHVADSKGVMFLRGDNGLDTYYRAPAASTGRNLHGMEAIESVFRGGRQVATSETLLGHGYVKLDPQRMLYVVHAPEAANPYGTSKIRSLEFVSQILLRIENAVGRSWERYGDPPLHLKYQTKARLTPDELEDRKRELQKSLADALRAKADGNSMDLVTAIGALDEIAIEVIGAAGIALSPAEPIKAIKEEFFAKLGTPAWLLGLDGSGGTGQAERQSEMVLQSSKTRFARRNPGLTRLVATMLRLRGRTWKPGDWKLAQDLPNLQDMMKIAQAKFLTAQAEQVSGRAGGQALQGIDNNLRTSSGRPRAKASGAKANDDEDDHAAEPWAVDEEYLGRLERTRTSEQLGRWWALAEEVAVALGFNLAAHRFVAPASETDWRFQSSMLANLVALGERYTVENSGADAPVLRAMWEAWARGWTTAAEELSAEAVIANVEERVRQALLQRGGERVRIAVGRAYMQRVVAELAAGALDGQSPVAVALDLQQKFEAGEYDWERLTRTEMAMAHSDGQLELYAAEGLELYDFTTAGSGVCPICVGLARGGPYRVGDPLSPVPGRDSHPGCRCAVAPHVT